MGNINTLLILPQLTVTYDNALKTVMGGRDSDEAMVNPVGDNLTDYREVTDNVIGQGSAVKNEQRLVSIYSSHSELLHRKINT